LSTLSPRLVRCMLVSIARSSVELDKDYSASARSSKVLSSGSSTSRSSLGHRPWSSTMACNGGSSPSHSHCTVTRIVSYRIVSSRTNHLTNPEVVVIDHLRHAQISGQTRRIRRRRQKKMGCVGLCEGEGTLKGDLLLQTSVSVRV
jgi:hypothetical protein